MWKIVLILLAATVLAAGCLIMDTDHTLYLDPDGALTWSVLEKDVRSDEEDPGERLEEERAYLERAWRNEHEAAEGLYALRPLGLETRVLRDRRPYTVLTTARFPSIDAVFQEMLDLEGIPGRAVLEDEFGLRRFVVTIPLDDLDLEENDEEAEGECETVLGFWDINRILLTEGEFVEAIGFEIDGDSAVLKEIDEETLERGGELTLSLTWTTVS